MAERRMFTKKITEADQFTELPPTAQALYFHLCMSADDDGFSNEIRKAMFNAHASTTDFNVLVAARFIIPFDSGVIVIKHWKMHNYIRNDRYNSTAYVEEKATLILKENGVYTEKEKPCLNCVDTIGIPTVNQMETEVRIGKDSVGKVRTVKDSSCSTELNDMFETFWSEYPRKEAKKDAKKLFIGLKPDKELLDAMLQAIEEQKASEQWQNPQYIPQPTKWLRGKRWEDEVPHKHDGFDNLRNLYERFSKEGKNEEE